MKKSVLILAMLGLSASLLKGQTFTLKSSDLGGQATNKQVFNGFGCKGENISPQLSWENAPAQTKSFVITAYDPDAPTGSGWWHWLVFDIPANVNELKSGAGDILKNLIPQGAVQSKTDFGSYGYGGPCPPEGDDFHRYVFTVHALKVGKLGLDKNAAPALVGFYLKQNTIAKASIIAYYKR